MSVELADGSGEVDGPRFSIISAVYNVAPYLDDFIASMEAQTFDLDRVEIIAVDDGSTDESLSRLREWHARRPGLVTVLSKTNGGQASARNAGLAVARGQWITFTDPDDMVNDAYLAAVDRFLTLEPEVVLVGTRRILIQDSGGARSKHPLDRDFGPGTRVVDLAESGIFYGAAPCAFVPRDMIERLALRFDEELKPSFEDGHFVASLLLGAPTRRIGLVAEAEYLYRRRSDSTSGGSLQDPRRFTTVLSRGYLDVLRRSAGGPGGPPAWLQNMILYDISWLFGAADRDAGPPLAAHGAVAIEFNELMTEIFDLIEPKVIETFSARSIPALWRAVWLHGYSRTPWRPSTVTRDRHDPKQRLDRIRYRFTGELPAEAFSVGGKTAVPARGRVRDITYFERVVLRERIVWVTSGPLQMRLDGALVEVQTHKSLRETPARAKRPVVRRLARRLARPLRSRRR